MLPSGPRWPTVPAVAQRGIEVEQHEARIHAVLAFFLVEQAQAFLAGAGAADLMREAGGARGFEHGGEVFVGIFHHEETAGR